MQEKTELLGVMEIHQVLWVLFFLEELVVLLE
jgi:hypothetical protein